ncbi:MAG: alpha-D-ribose 1-methylphosphonate 5-triphosphate diphosphatase [Dehalococcoidia bacterium]
MSNETQRIAISNATIVLPEALIEGGSLGIAGGRIVEVEASGNLQGEYDVCIDAEGAYVMPGVIDLHNDSLETEINPRPETSLPVDFALANLERRLLFSGVTMEFHAISFMNNTKNGRTVANAADRAHLVHEYARSGHELISNNVLHRLDVWTPDGLDYIFESLARAETRYVSINDHTPGQGQYRDIEAFKERMEAWKNQRGRHFGGEDAEKRMMERAADTETVPMVYARIREERQRMPFVIASHDDDTPEKVDTLFAMGASVCEFPVTVEAAERGRSKGMTIVVGAPNIVRGGSSSGNMDAAELVRLGLADAICADYHAPSMLPAAFRLYDDDLVDLPAAVRMLSLNPARALGIDDLGAVLPGYVADLLFVRRTANGMPAVERVIRGGREVMNLRPSRRVEVPA